MRTFLVALMVVTLAITIAACGGSSSDDGANAPSATGGSSSPKRVRVYVLLPSVEDEAYIREKAGAELQKTKEKNADITIDAGSGRFSPDAMIQKVQSAITQRYDVLAINPAAAAEQLAPTLNRAVARGTKVVAFDQDLPGVKGKSTYIVWDSLAAGRLIGNWWKTEGLPQGGKIGVIRCAIGNPLLDGYENGFKEGIAGSKISVVAREDTLCDVAKSRAAAENMLTAHSDLVGFFADTDLGLEGIQQAVKSAKKDFVLTGSGAAKAVLEGMTKGGPTAADADTTFPFEGFGARAVREAVRIARGEKPSPSMTIGAELVTRANAQKVLDEINAIGGS